MRRSHKGGLGLQDLALSPYDPTWAVLYGNAAGSLRALPGSVQVEHIGSTAIPGIHAKPVIDIALTVSSAPDSDILRRALAALGYVSHGEYGLPGRQFFTRGNPPEIHLHVVGPHSPHWDDWLTFRDYLLQHPEWVKGYEEEKRRLVALVKGDRASYTRQKGAFIKDVLRRARAES